MSVVQNISRKGDHSSMQPHKTENSVEKYKAMYRNQGGDSYHNSISALPQIRNVNPNYASTNNQGNHIVRLDSTTTSLQSVGGFTLNSQYRNIRTFSNLYPNASKGFSLPSISMKNSSIFMEKQRIGVSNPLNKPTFQPNSSLYMPDLMR